MNDWTALAAAMTERLVAEGDLTDPNWHRAFLETPRHIFVPGHDQTEAYAPTALVTQSRIADAHRNERPTSSLSAPSVVATMLEMLEVADGHRVLEIGTGTGYNAALLCHRLGADNVFSVDLDPELVDAARRPLVTLDRQPTLVATDGYGGLTDGAPYDRIIATCSVDHVPPEWVRQLADGGRTVAPLIGYWGAPMVLDKTAPDEVTGRFDGRDVGFMPLRHEVENPLGPAESTGMTSTGMAHYGTTITDPRRVHEAGTALALFCRLHASGLRFGWGTASGQPDDPANATEIVAHTADAVATVAFEAENGRWPVLQHGPRRVWDSIETAVALWDHLEQPDQSRLGISALDHVDRQYVWLDDPDGLYAWPMPL